MTTKRITVTALGVVVLAGCATTPREKPVLTATAAKAIARSCHAVSGTIGHDHHSELPSAQFVLPPGASSADDHVAPMVACLSTRLAAYRYGMMSFGEARDAVMR
jgi:hypothetical protein